ncbi:MAG: hypothetical protein JWO67_4172 [Streptosporangiaceae bacterium]|nr:hypothetical protein [Streptosporangiaceae bacterium]
MAQQFLHPLLAPVGYRRDGRPIYPILGGSEPPTQSAAPAPAPPAPAAPSDKGYPDGTPLEQMNAEQREAYWKHQARKHEDRVKAYGGLTPEQAAELREKASRADALEYDLLSDKDKAVAEAAQNARWAAEAEFTPRLVNAEFRIASAGRIEAERLATILEPLDLSKFLTDSGEVDTAKVAAFVDGIAPPVTGTPAPPPRPGQLGPSPSGLGGRPGSSASPSVASGRELYAQRHRSRSSA